MRLLFDQNLSPRLIPQLADIFPECIHVSALGMEQALDKAIWEYARQEKLLIVTKDADFGEFSSIWGYPPKVIWIQRGNCSTREIELLLRQNEETINDFAHNHSIGILALV